MSKTLNLTNHHLLTLGGISGILAGLLIITFAILSESKGVFFTPEIYTGGSIENWIQNLSANKGYVNWFMILMIGGFSSMFLTAFVLYQILPANSWQKSLSIVAYAIGGLMVLPASASHQSTVNYINSLLSKGEIPIEQIQLLVGSAVYRWMIVNDYLGPLFIIVLGTGFMTWAILKARLLPKWLCYWSLIVSTLLFLSFFNSFIPILGVLGNAAPFHMLWFIILGVYLLRIKRSLD